MLLHAPHTGLVCPIRDSFFYLRSFSVLSGRPRRPPSEFFGSYMDAINQRLGYPPPSPVLLHAPHTGFVSPIKQ